MSLQKPTTYTLIDRKLIVYQRERSAIWQCRFNVDGRWQRTSTGTRDLADAKAKAHDILVEANTLKKLNVAPITRRFKDIANAVIKKLKAEMDSGDGKAIYKDYISAIDKYLIPTLGKYAVNNIGYKELELLDKARIKKMEKQPTRSTLLNHNAALKMISDEAIYKGYMVELNRPKLVAKGKASERRAEFTLNETRAIKSNFEAWIKKGRADSVELRKLLRDYVYVLLDTGARPGKELLELKWTQVELKMHPTIKKTGVIEKPNEYDDRGSEIEAINANRTVIINIQDSKTDSRLSIGRADTAKALEAIAQRNYGKTTAKLIKEGCTDYIFTYTEYIDEKKVKRKRKPKLIRPTSFSKLFDNYLESHNLQTDLITGKKRVLYSLRHTYATLALTHDKVAIHKRGVSVEQSEAQYRISGKWSIDALSYAYKVYALKHAPNNGKKVVWADIGIRANLPYAKREKAIEGTLSTTLVKTNFWQHWPGTPMNERQIKLLNKLLDGFDGKLTSSKWAIIAKCSPDTALRDITDLLERGALVKSESRGRSTSYELRQPINNT